MIAELSPPARRFQYHPRELYNQRERVCRHTCVEYVSLRAANPVAGIHTVRPIGPVHPVTPCARARVSSHLPRERKRERERGESGQLATLSCSYSNNHRINSSHKHWHHPNRASSKQSFRATTLSPFWPFISINSTESHPKKLHLRARGAIKNLTQNAASKSPSRPRSPLP